MSLCNSRRRAIALGLGVLGAATLAGVPWTRSAAAESPRQRSLELKNLHTGEVLQVTFDHEAGPDPATLAKLQHFLRDYRVNEEHAMDPALFSLLSDLAISAGKDARYEVISGYRSPGTNARLHAEGHGVAEHSLHMEGRAIDVRLPGFPTHKLRDLGHALRRGGVGYYPASDFVHLDTGRVRFW